MRTDKSGELTPRVVGVESFFRLTADDFVTRLFQATPQNREGFRSSGSSARHRILVFWISLGEARRTFLTEQ